MASRPLSLRSQPRARPRARLIVGIDYGTTYSGISFAMSTALDFRDIHPWTAYPGSSSHSSGHCEKAPTLVAFASENDELDEDAWGYQVEPGMKTYAWTKLLLDSPSLPTEYDDPSLKGSTIPGMVKLPPGRTAKHIVTAYLRGIHDMYQAAVAEKFGKHYLKDLPVNFWLTVPATWSDEAKQVTKDAALDAGFASRPGDYIRLIPEPEAAAHLALKLSVHQVSDLVEASFSDNHILEGSSVMICDLGGGTVDITCYEIQETSPSLKLREICVGGGGKCGGTFVDRNFHQLMEKRFGTAFTSLGSEMIGPGSRFMDQFEMSKRDFSMKIVSRRPRRLLLPMRSLQMNTEMEKYYEDLSGCVLLTQDDMKSLFDPVGDMILNLVSDQVKRAKGETGKDIDNIVLVGGFGSSSYIKDILQEWCGKHIRLTTPWKGAWSAIVCGAVLRGIEGAITTERRCRRHYGYNSSELYDEVLHKSFDENTRYIFENPFEHELCLTGFMRWWIHKNDILTSDSSISHHYRPHLVLPLASQYTFTLYSCSSDEALDTIDNAQVEEVGDVLYTLDRLDLTKVDQAVRKDGTTQHFKILKHALSNSLPSFFGLAVGFIKDAVAVTTRKEKHGFFQLKRLLNRILPRFSYLNSHA
ncbi:hypothetical protein AK830_g4382 [Neonectria ditissima]|uniref:Uncharacterized protein n=1 Tax=Neonectria ditissima TaxID=78410 RepID=A0A0P7B6G8_9HYPO|nr:hypothetical protein AK830_g4382 [Neonectria ditissima]